MFEDNRWRRMLKPGITAIVGAGGKTTVLERLGTYGHGGHLPIMVSSIVPMDSTRADNLDTLCVNTYLSAFITHSMQCCFCLVYLLNKIAYTIITH